MWLLFTHQLWTPGHDDIAAGDEVVFGKAGQETYGLGRFFSSLQQRAIPGLSFFAFSLIDVQERHSSPIQVAQIVKAVPEKKNRDKESAESETRETAGGSSQREPEQAG